MRNTNTYFFYMYVCMYKKLKRKQNIVDACEKQKKNTEFEKI